MPDERLETGLAWAAERLDAGPLNFESVAGDASFRRYFRLRGGKATWILMDAPPEREDSRPFVDVADRLQAGGVHAPEIFASDLDRGFLLLEDLGNDLLRDRLDTNNADGWFTRLFAVLDAMATQVDADGLPEYDRGRLLDEMELFPAWYLERHCGIQLSCADWDAWEALCTHLVHWAYEQPRTFVHRDFHSCNLLPLDGGGVGVIDFQDAVRGPVTYDLVSLLWDRYIAWPRSRLEAWVDDFRRRVAPEVEPAKWLRWCEGMALQRNLKIIGIFARLHHRDGKERYLALIPRFWGYVVEVLPRHPEFADFERLLERLECAP